MKILLTTAVFLFSTSVVAAPNIPVGTTVEKITNQYGKQVAKGCTPQLGDSEEYLIYREFRVLTNKKVSIALPEDSKIDFDIDKIRKRQSLSGFYGRNNSLYQVDVVCF